LRLFGAGAGDCRRLCGPILTPSSSFHGAAKRIPWNLGTPCKPIPPHRIPTQAPPNPLCTSATCVENSKENPVNHENPVHPVKSPSSSCLSPKTSASICAICGSFDIQLCQQLTFITHYHKTTYKPTPLVSQNLPISPNVLQFRPCTSVFIRVYLCLSVVNFLFQSSAPSAPPR
jgi:hypothetical protein